MPRCLDPGARFELYLDSDAEKPEGERPTFVFRVLSVREWYAAMEGHEYRLDAARAVLAAAVSGWRNLKKDDSEIPFAAGELEAVLDAFEVVELFDKLQVSYADKKKLPSQQPSTVDSSAPVVAEASA